MTDETLRRVEAALSALPPKQRTAFLLRNHQGLSIHEIPKIMQTAEGTAKVHLHRAVMALRKRTLFGATSGAGVIFNRSAESSCANVESISQTGQGGRTCLNLSPKGRPSPILPYSHHHTNAGSRNTENQGKGLLNDFFRSLSGRVPITLPCRGYAFDRKGSS